MDFVIPVDHWVNRKENEILESCQKAEKTVEHQDDSDTNNSCCTKNSPQRFGKETGGIGNQLGKSRLKRPLHCWD